MSMARLPQGYLIKRRQAHRLLALAQDGEDGLVHRHALSGLQRAASSCCLPRRCAPHSTHEPQTTSSTTALLLLEVIDGAYEKLTVQTAHARPYTDSYFYIDKTKFQRTVVRLIITPYTPRVLPRVSQLHMRKHRCQIVHTDRS